MRLIACLVACLALCWVSSADAQTAGAGAPLLGGGQTTGNVSQSLTAGGSLGANFYDLIEPKVLRIDGTSVPRRSAGASATGSLTYSLTYRQLNLSAGLSGFLNYYSGRAFRKGLGMNDRIGASWSASLTPRTRLTLSTGATARPLRFGLTSANGFGALLTGNPNEPIDDASLLFPGAPEVAGTQVMFNAGAVMLHDFTRRLAGTVNYGYRQDFVVGGPPELTALGTHQIGSSLNMRLTRFVTANAAYGIQQSRDRSGVTRRSQQFNGGLSLNYGRGFTIQLTRNTTLDFAGGVSSYVTERGGTQFRLNGNVDLVHQVSRVWSLSAVYSRGVSASDILFGAPTLFDRVSAGVAGGFGRRVTARADVNADRSIFLGTATGNGRTRSGASASLQTALASRLAIAASYWFTRYTFTDDARLIAGLGRRTAAQGVRIYLTSSLPIFSRARRPNATR